MSQLPTVIVTINDQIFLLVKTHPCLLPYELIHLGHVKDPAKEAPLKRVTGLNKMCLPFPEPLFQSPRATTKFS